jgi:hypothetical protein
MSCLFPDDGVLGKLDIELDKRSVLDSSFIRHPFRQTFRFVDTTFRLLFARYFYTVSGVEYSVELGGNSGRVLTTPVYS